MSLALLPWLKFALCACLIAVAGPALARSGETIARITGISRSWIGLVLLATATSLPELFTGVSAAAAAVAPDIAVGDALGSCVFNLVLLVLLDVFGPREPSYRRMEQGHMLTAAFGVVLIGLVGALLLVGRGDLDLRIFHIGIYTPLLIILYFGAMRALYVHQRGNGVVASPDEAAPPMGLRAAILRYVAAAVVIAVAGSWLPFVGLEIAGVMGWGTSFVGTILIATATSLPELVVTVAAARLGAVDMAVGNLLGSNLFNILVIAIDDLAYAEGSLLAAASPVHAGSAFAAVIMSGMFIAALLQRSRAPAFGRLGWMSLLLPGAYLLNAYATFQLAR